MLCSIPRNGPPRVPRLLAIGPALAVAQLVAGCGGGGGGGPAAGPAAPAQSTPSAGAAVAQPLSPAAQLGQLIFKDTSLSASGRLSCASCHDPQRAHASPFASPVALGGPNLDQPGLRNPPSLRYLKFNGSFRLDPGSKPVGGFFWDGRSATLQEQARVPFLNPREMANPDAVSLVAKVAAAPYAAQFRAVFGDTILSQPDAAFDRVAFALQQYQVEDAEFAPFSSKFDAVNAGTATFTPQELNGLALFNRPDKGNCAACHPSTKPANAPAALFTDFSYDNVGVPRNTLVTANDDPAFFDGGLCGSTRADFGTRTDLATRGDLCGAFKVPSLRNVGVRKHFFHNGVFTSLEQVLRFYVRRDTDPLLWYSSDPLGNPIPYDDTPATLRGNVITGEAPYDRHPGQAPALTPGEIDDLASFLRTLTDTFTPS